MAHSKDTETAGILVLGRVLATIGEAIVLLVIVRLLGKVEVGILAGLLLVHKTLALVLASGFPAALMFHLPGRPAEERKAIAWKSAQTLFILGIANGLILLALSQLGEIAPGAIHHLMGGSADPAEQTSVEYLALLALLPMADLPVRLLPNFLVIEKRPRAAAGVNVIVSLGNSVAILVPLALGMSIWVVVGSLVLFGWAYSGVLVYYLRAAYPKVPRIASPISTWGLFKFSMPLGLTDTISVLNKRLDRYLILLFLPLARLAEYETGAWQIPMVTTIPYAVGTAFAPRFSKLFKEGRTHEAIAIWRESIAKVSLLVVPVAMAFIVAAEETIELLFTADYRVAAWVFRWYCVFTLMRVTAFGIVIVSAGRPGLILRASVFTFLSNLFISLPLVLLIGFEGPALGTALAFVPSIAAYCWYIAKATDLRFREVFPLVAYLKVVGMALVAGAVGVLVKLSLHLPIAAMLGLEVVCVLAAFALLGTVLGLITRDDWRFLWDWLRLKSLFRPSSGNPPQ